MNIRNLSFRYLFLIMLAFQGFFIIYYLFTPLTIHPLVGLFKLFFDASLTENIIYINGNYSIQIINACIAGSAYYLLLALNLTTPKQTLKKRLNVIAFSFGLLLILNISRIFISTIILMNNAKSFEAIHEIFWYVGSTFFVVFIWFTCVKLFKIKEIPVYSDVVSIWQRIRR